MNNIFTKRRVSKEEYDKFMIENKIVAAHVITFAEPTVKFYWTNIFPDMSFGQHSVASRVQYSLSPYYENKEDDLFLHDYGKTV